MANVSGDDRDECRSASTVLVYDTPFAPPAETVCPSLCQSERTAARDVIAVLATERPSEYLRAWKRANGHLPERLRIVSVDPGASPGSTAACQHVVDRVSSPENLTALGVAITEALAECDDAAPAVCLDSLTPLLQYVDRDRAVRFLHELTARFEAVDATAHVHLDPSAHERRTIGALARVFDDVVDLTETGRGSVECGAD